MGKSRLSWTTIQTLTAAASIIGVAANQVPRQVNGTGPLMPIFSFAKDTLQPYTCQGVDVYWFYIGPPGTVNLYATNVGVSQVTPAPSSSVGHLAAALPSGVDDTRNVTMTLGTDIDPSILSFRWSSVNVPQGWYIFNASMPAQAYSATSDPFYVHTGNDTSCISNFLTPTSSVNSSESTSWALASSSPVTSQSNTISIGAIIGASFGLTAVLAAIVLACVWFKRGRRRKSNRHGKGEYPQAMHHWKELGSADSRGALRGNQPGPYHQSSNNSLRTVIHPQSDEETGADKSSIHSKLESSAHSYEQDVALSTLPVLTHQSSRSRTFAVERPHSSSSSATFGPSAPGHSATLESGPSVRDAMSSRRSLNATYPPTRPTSSPAGNSSHPNHDQRASMQLLSTPYEHSRPSRQPGSQIAMEATKQANRQSLGRKRKPVPVYDGEEPTSPSVPPPLPTSPVSPSSSPLEAFLSASPTPSSVGHYVTRNHSIQEAGHPDLILKGNFGPGDKPVHYLIPDMPMSQQ